MENNNDKKDELQSSERTNVTANEMTVEGDNKPQKEKFTLKIFMKEWVIPITCQMLVIWLLLKYVFFITNVPSGSMLPTIQLNSWLFATRVHNPEKTIQRGDVVIFTSDETGLILIKRCIGLPGESVHIDENGNITIGGAPLEEKYVVNTSKQSPQDFYIPYDNYLFLGDNRSGSADARVWQNPYIPSDKIIGEAHFTFYPFTNFGVLK